MTSKAETTTEKPKRRGKPFTSEMARKARARPGAGRQKGTPNKLNKSVKEAIVAAFETLGHEHYLVKKGNKDFKTFASLLAKVIPTQIEAQVNVTHEDALKELE